MNLIIPEFKTLKVGDFDIQFYWPHGRIRNNRGYRELHFAIETHFRVAIWPKDQHGKHSRYHSFAAGFAVLGLGIGVQRAPR